MPSTESFNLPGASPINASYKNDVKPQVPARPRASNGTTLDDPQRRRLSFPCDKHAHTPSQKMAWVRRIVTYLLSRIEQAHPGRMRPLDSWSRA